jgi:hypothetical protein
MPIVKIAPIVEGHGEVEAVPILIRRIAQLIKTDFIVSVLPPLRVPANRLLKAGEIERTVNFAARKIGGRGGILVLIDCDWAECCPAQDGPKLLERALSVHKDLPIAVVLAKQEFEAWFLAAAESLRGKRGLPWDLQPPKDPENIRGAKEWLSKKMISERVYSETTDQPALTAEFDMDLARCAGSFDKCFRDIQNLIRRASLLKGNHPFS